ncbi:MAG: tetratricopeptide repeat protein [Elusimicrobia bacterium]|nr:tetratricopeptide repeat protein [Elusimicrobiota bacterium]
MNRKKITVSLILLLLALAPQSHAIYRVSSRFNPYYHYLLGRFYIHKGELQRGIGWLEQAYRLDRDSWALQWDLLELYYITGDYRKAREVGSRMYNIDPMDAHLTELLADVYTRLGNKDRALELYQNLSTIEPSNNMSQLNIASIYESNGDFKSALKQYMDLLKKEPDNVFLRLSIADIYLKLSKYDTAVKNYLEALKYGADPNDVYLQIARVYSHVGKYRQAEKYLLIILDEHPQNVQVMYLLSEVYQNWKKYEDAEKILISIQDMGGNNIGLMLKLGALYSDMGKVDKALETFREATRLYPDEFTSWYFLGLTYEYREEYAEAEEVLLKAADLKDDPQVYLHLGVVNDKMGNHEKAYGMFKKCLELDPDHSVAHNYIGYTWAEKGINLDEAEKHIIRALVIEPENAAYIDSLGWIYYKQGKYEEALKVLKRAAELSDDPVILEHLGDAYAKLEQASKAEKTYKRALKEDPDNKELQEKLHNLK